MWLHDDQVRQVAVDCRNPMKAGFSHLPWLEGTFGITSLPRIDDTAKRGRIRCFFPPYLGFATGSSETNSSVETLPFFMNTASG